MKQSEFLRWLMQHGVQVKQGAKHLKLYANGEQTILPRHPSTELKQALVDAVKKKLRLVRSRVDSQQRRLPCNIPPFFHPVPRAGT